MKHALILLLAVILFLPACTGVGEQHAMPLPTKTGRNTFSVTGMALVSEVTEGVTRPYMEKGMARTCPNGFIYDDYREAVNRVTIAGTWVEWAGVIQCRKPGE